MSLEVMHFTEPQPEPHGDEDGDITLGEVYFIERKSHPGGEIHPLIEERQKIQRMMAWWALIRAELGPLEIEGVVEMMKNNEQRRDQGVDVAVTDNFRYAPVHTEADIIAVRNFLRNAPLGESPERPQLHIVENQ